MTNRFLPLLCVMICLALLLSCAKTFYVQPSHTRTSVIVVDTNAAFSEDSATLKYILPYKKQLDEQMNEIIAYADIPLKKNEPEGTLNNFVADLILYMTNKYLKENNKETADICLLNTGGLRCDLPKGSITVRNIYELMPFDNEVVVLKLTAANIKKMCDYIAKKGGMPVSGLTMSIKHDTAAIIKIHQQNLDFSKEYRVVTSDYLAAGGDAMTFFANPIERTNLNILVRDMIIAYLKQQTAEGKTVSSALDKRIYYEK